MGSRKTIGTEFAVPTHPWLEIPLADYEGHMALPSIAQAELLSTTLARVCSTFQPRSLAVLGVAGGNGLERVDPSVVKRVVAIDFNPEYLRICSQRYAGSFERFEPILHDLSGGVPDVAAVECLFAGLVLEYLQPEPRFGDLLSLLHEGGLFAVVLQMPSSPEVPVVSNSPFVSLAPLHSKFSFVRPEMMDAALRAQGCSLVYAETEMVCGKTFHSAAYRLDHRAGV
jgi:hypothetical protein